MYSFILFVRYLIGGGLAFIVHLATLAILVERYGLFPLYATSLAFCVACIFNYSFQYYLTFKASSAHAGTFIRFFAVAVFMLGLNGAIFWVLTEKFAVPYLYSQATASAIIMFCNFAVNKLYTFNYAHA